MRQPVCFYCRVAAGLALAAWFLVVGPGCAGGAETTRTGCGRGGGSSYTPRPVPLSRYVGTWKGPWSVLDTFLPNPAKGEMTLTVEPTGAFSGQLTNETTGQSGSVSGKITTHGADGTADITTTFADQSERDFTQILILQTNDHLRGSMRVPAGRVFLPDETLPGTPRAPWVLASFDIVRQ